MKDESIILCKKFSKNVYFYILINNSVTIGSNVFINKHINFFMFFVWIKIINIWINIIYMEFFNGTFRIFKVLCTNFLYWLIDGSYGFFAYLWWIWVMHFIILVYYIIRINYYLYIFLYTVFFIAFLLFSVLSLSSLDVPWINMFLKPSVWDFLSPRYFLIHLYCFWIFVVRLFIVILNIRVQL